MSLFAAFETQQTPESKPRYTEEELLGKGLQRLSYFVESRYVTRRFKNHLKSLGLFRPAYRKQDRQQVYFNRPPIRKYSDSISNRKFKFNWIVEHKGLKGLKDQPRKLVVQPPLHVGTIVHSRGIFYPNPLLDKYERRLVDTPIKRVKRALKKALKKVLCESQGLEQPEVRDSGQPPADPAGHAFVHGSFNPKRVVLVSTEGEYPTLLGGQTFPNKEALMRAWSRHTGTFKFFQRAKRGPAKQV